MPKYELSDIHDYSCINMSNIRVWLSLIQDILVDLANIQKNQIIHLEDLYKALETIKWLSDEHK